MTMLQIAMVQLSGVAQSGVEFKIPHYSSFNDWKKYPEVVDHEARLNRMNLSDPWKRNFAWGFGRTDGGEVYTSQKSLVPHLIRNLFKPFKAGLVPGLSIAAALIAAEETYSYLKHGHTSWSHGHGHGDEHH